MIRKILSVFLVVCLFCSVSVAPATAALVEGVTTVGIAAAPAEGIVSVTKAVEAMGLAAKVGIAAPAEGIVSVTKAVELTGYQWIGEVAYDLKGLKGVTKVLGVILNNGAVGYAVSVAGVGAMLVVEIVAPYHFMKKYNLPPFSPLPLDVLDDWRKAGDTAGSTSSSPLTSEDVQGETSNVQGETSNVQGGTSNVQGETSWLHRLQTYDHNITATNRNNVSVYKLHQFTIAETQRTGYMIVRHNVNPSQQISITREGMVYNLNIDPEVHGRMHYVDEEIVGHRCNLTRTTIGDTYYLTEDPAGTYMLLENPPGYLLFPV